MLCANIHNYKRTLASNAKLVISTGITECRVNIAAYRTQWMINCCF